MMVNPGPGVVFVHLRGLTWRLTCGLTGQSDSIKLMEFDRGFTPVCCFYTLMVVGSRIVGLHSGAVEC